MPVPFLDLPALHRRIADEVGPAFENILANTAFIGGAAVQNFEAEFAKYCGVKHCVGVANGTDALQLALEALGIGAGDEVITVPNTFIATAEAISRVNADLVLCDVLEDTHLMDPAALEKAITPKTKAVIPVHLFGQPCDMPAIRAIADKHGLKVIEDAAQAHGATCQGKPVGSLGDIACFSFYPGKNLGAYGDGGAVVSNDDALIETIRCLANHGRASHTEHALIGMNSRLDGLQGCVLGIKLPHLDAWNAERREAAARYDAMFADVEGVTPVAEAEGMVGVYHLYVVRVADRAGLMDHLKAKGIGCGLHYRLPVHRTEAYAALGLVEGSFPVSEALQASIISLPMYPGLTEEQQREVVDAVKSFV